MTSIGMTVTPEHRRDHAHGMTGRRLRMAFFLTAIILMVELAGGVISHSLALLSDAGHVLTDIFALGLAWFATVQAERPANARKRPGPCEANARTSRT
jgi:cobalt-zinc-cadmium efflux system protein